MGLDSHVVLKYILIKPDFQHTSCENYPKLDCSELCELIPSLLLQNEWEKKYGRMKRTAHD